MRNPIVVFAPLVWSCEPWKVPEPGEETGTADLAETGAGPEDVADSSPDTGPLAEGEEGADYVGHPCDPLGVEHGTCCLLIEGSDPPHTITAVDTAVGGEGVTVLDLDWESGTDDDGWSTRFTPLVTGLGRHGDILYACGGTVEARTIDLSDASVRKISNLACGSAAPWKGDAPYAGGIVIHGVDVVLRWFADPESLADGLPDDYIGETGSTTTRITIYDDVLLGASHSDSTLSRWSLPGMEELPELPLEGFDSWIWGMSVVDGVLYLIDDGRSDEDIEEVRLFSFDVETGAQLGFVSLTERTTDWRGLHCESR